MPDSPKPSDIREFLFDFFNDEELATLCFDFFPEVQDNFTTGMTKQHKIIELLGYCQRREIVPNLLAALQRMRPEPYYKRFPQSAQAIPQHETARPQRDPRQVFISHAHEDAKFAHDLADDLRHNGWRVWIAPESIRPGEMWGEGVDRGLDESGVLVLALTPRSVESQWVRKETYAAIQIESQGQIRFIPLEVEPCNVPGLWSTYQRISFRSSYASGLSALLDELEPERRARHEREAQAQAARAQAEQLEREMEARRQAAQAEAERQARLAAETAEADRVERARQDREAREKAARLEAAQEAQTAKLEHERQERAARLERILARLRDPLWQRVGAFVAIFALVIALGVWLWPTLGIGLTRNPEKDGMVMVYVPVGEFLMGSADSDSQATSGEKPQHKVTLDAFWIDRTEVTNAQYKKCVEAKECNASSYADGSNFNGDNQPVVGVDWNDAKRYCAWAGRQLPTEAQWEKAARGTDGRIYPWGNQAATCEYAVMNDGSGDGCGQGSAAWAVGSKLKGASPYGAWDMAGNVWEWVADWYDEKYYGSSPPKNPMGPTSGQYRVLRGGAMYYEAQLVRAAFRYRDSPGVRYYNLGFRCSRGTSP